MILLADSKGPDWSVQMCRLIWSLAAYALIHFTWHGPSDLWEVLLLLLFFFFFSENYDLIVMQILFSPALSYIYYKILCLFEYVIRL